MGLRLDLRQVVYVLSDALDLVGVDDVAHGKRVAYMAVRIAETLGLPRPDLEALLHGGLFHDCGVSSTREHRSLSGSLDWDGEEDHCIRGARRAASFEPLAVLAPLIRWHHAHADRLDQQDLPDQVRLLANLIYLADRVDVLAATHVGGDILLVRQDIRSVVAENRRTRFRGDAVDAFLQVSAPEEFWLMMEPRALGPWLGRRARQPDARDLSLEDLRSLGAMFAAIVDAKSPFTAEHSLGVAALAGRLAAQAGTDPERRGSIEVAGLLHDIGKLRVPDRVLDKPADLDGPERVRITRHAFDTYQILSRIEGFEEIARWAAHHHEWVKGGGYPFGVGGADFSPEARIVAVADVFQALAQDRPYRQRMPLSRILETMDRMVASGKLDGDVVALVHRDPEDCLEAATRPTSRLVA